LSSSRHLWVPIYAFRIARGTHAGLALQPCTPDDIPLAT